MANCPIYEIRTYVLPKSPVFSLLPRKECLNKHFQICFKISSCPDATFVADMDSAGPPSLQPLEDKFSIVLSRLESIETSLRELQDIKKVLREIEGNTHPEGDGKSVPREDLTEKVL